MARTARRVRATKIEFTQLEVANMFRQLQHCGPTPPHDATVYTDTTVRTATHCTAQHLPRGRTPNDAEASGCLRVAQQPHAAQSKAHIMALTIKGVGVTGQQRARLTSCWAASAVPTTVPLHTQPVQRSRSTLPSHIQRQSVPLLQCCRNAGCSSPTTCLVDLMQARQRGRAACWHCWPLALMPA